MTTTTTATKTSRSNLYAGTCSRCGGHVAAQTGLLGSRVNGRWTVTHTNCPATPAPGWDARTATVRTAPRSHSSRTRCADCGARLTAQDNDGQCFDCQP